MMGGSRLIHHVLLVALVSSGLFHVPNVAQAETCQARFANFAAIFSPRLYSHRVDPGWKPVRIENVPGGSRILFKYREKDRYYDALLFALRIPEMQTMLAPLRIAPGPAENQIWTAPAGQLQKISEAMVKRGEMTFSTLNSGGGLLTSAVKTEVEVARTLGRGQITAGPGFLNHDLNAHLLAAFMNKNVAETFQKDMRFWLALYDAPEFRKRPDLKNRIEAVLMQLNGAFESQTTDMSRSVADYAEGKISRDEFESLTVAAYRRLSDGFQAAGADELNVRQTPGEQFETFRREFEGNDDPAVVSDLKVLDRVFERVRSNPDFRGHLDRLLSDEDLQAASRETATRWLGPPQ